MKNHDRANEQLLQELGERYHCLQRVMETCQAELRGITDLRRKAEDSLRQRHSRPAEDMTDTDIRALVLELQVHQIELEFQNQELATAHVDAQELSEKYGDLFDFAPIGYFVWDALGHILEINLAGATLLGLDRSAALNKRFGQFVVPEDRVAFFEFCQRAVEADAKQRCEIKLLIADKAIHLLIVGSAVQDRRGKGGHCRAAALDITDRVGAEEALRQSQCELRAIYDHVPWLMCVVDSHRRVIYSNRAMSAFAGRLEETLQGDRAGGLLGCVNALEDPRGCGHGTLCEFCPLRLAILDTFQTGTSHQGIDYRTTLERKGTRQATAFLGSTALIPSTGQPRLLLCLEDITARKKAEEEYHRLQQQLAHVVRLSTMGAMVAGISHEVSQPLHSIATFARACGNALSQDEVRLDWLREWNEAIAVAAARGGKIIKGLRAFLSNSEPQFAPTEIRAVIEESLSLVAFEMRDRHVTVDTQIDAADLVVRIERVQIQQVLVNLLQNACETLAERTEGTRKVSIRAAVAEEFVEVSVADNGLGLEDCNVSRIFDPFFTTKPHGMGMGLAISRTIVEAHGGRIWAIDSSAGGMAFHFTLPLVARGLNHAQ
ncbi:MAG: PAS domain-containing sensor histidine kinase [Pirellulaceae bacterium]